MLYMASWCSQGTFLFSQSNIFLCSLCFCFSKQKNENQIYFFMFSLSSLFLKKKTVFKKGKQIQEIYMISTSQMTGVGDEIISFVCI